MPFWKSPVDPVNDGDGANANVDKVDIGRQGVVGPFYDVEIVIVSSSSLSSNNIVE